MRFRSAGALRPAPALALFSSAFLLAALVAPSVAAAAEAATSSASLGGVVPGTLEPGWQVESDLGARLRSAAGLFLMIAIAFLFSKDRKHIRWKPVLIGTGLQLVLGVVTRTRAGEWFFSRVNDVVTGLLGFTAAGSRFLFGRLADSNTLPVGPSVVPLPGAAAAGEAFQGAARMAPTAIPALPDQWVNVGAFFAFGVLPTIIFFSSLMALLYHFGVMQWVVRGISLVMQRTMGTSGSESLSTAGNIFLGQTEAPLLVRPFVARMTESELMAVMVGGFATVAGGVLAAYVGLLKNIFPDVAGHLLCASLMSAPATLVIAKVMVPEPDPKLSETYGDVKVDLRSTDANGIDAAARGAGEGLHLALNVGAMLLAFIALVAMFNALVGQVGAWAGHPALTIELILGYVLSPLAWMMGIPWEDCRQVGSLLGVKTVLNEFVAYIQLAEVGPGFAHRRSMVIASYALCGFANFSSIAVQIGGIGAMAPERRGDLARLGLRAMIGGTLASFMTACVIGLLI